MPLPTPRKGETRERFVERFAASQDARSEFPDQDQRLAAAFTRFRKGRRRSGMVKAIREAVSSAMGLVELRKARPAEFQIKKAHVESIALCRRGKNGFRTMLKSEDGRLELQALVKADRVAKSGELLFVAYAPDRPDHDGWQADQAVVKAMQRDCSRNGNRIDIEHDGNVLSADEAYVAETFIVQKSDERFQNWNTYDGEPAGDLTGAWGGVIQIDHPELRAACEAGEIDGVSVFGRAAVEPLRKSSAADDEMTPEQIKDLCKSVAESVVTALKAEQPKPAELPKDEPKPEQDALPAFEGDPSNPEDLAKFEKALKAHEFAQAVKSGKLTAEKVAELRKALTAVEPTDAEMGIKPEDDEEKRELRRQLFKSQRRTNAPSSPAPAPDKAQEQLDLAEGLALAKAMNEGGVSIPFTFHTVAG